MSDRFLQDHCIAARTYRVCAPLAPASIRDMSIRAEQLVLRLRDASIGAPPTQPIIPLIDKLTRVLIVGAGVAGMVCAASLLTYTDCRNVTLNDVFDHQLDTQTGNLHRFVSPHGFDWPYYFYRIDRHPLVGTSVLPWRAALADDVVKQFNYRFLNVVNSSWADGRYVQAFDSTITSWQYDPDRGWDVTFNRPPPGAEVEQHFDLVILCCGVSGETDTLCGYRGFRFWDRDDAFLTPPLLPLQSDDTVLICGGGDGGLNDFIRLVTGESVPQRLIPRLESAISEKFKQRYQAVQALTHRHYLIGGDPRYDQATLAYSFETHQKLARRLFARPPMQRALSEIIRPGHPHVQLLVRHYAFGRSYTPNAMLVSLLARAVAAMAKNGKASRPPLLLATDVKKVKPAAKNVFPTTAAEWAAQRIKVDFQPSAAFATSPQSDEVQRMLKSGIAKAGYSQRGEDFRCMFIRTGSDRKDHPAVTEVIEAIRQGTAHLPHVSEIRHALPQSPLPPY